MKRRLVTAIAAAALLALSVTAGAQNNEVPERTGERMGKPVVQSCPVHPEIKARSAGRCPKCRADQRNLKSARERDKGKVNRPQQAQPQEEGSAANE